MSKRSSGGSRAGIKNVGKNEVKVGGYVRSNGIYVAGYTRSAPRYKEEYSNLEDDVVRVSAYTRNDGTYVPAYFRAAPQRTHSEDPSPSSGHTQARGNRTKVSGNCKVSPQRTSKSSTVTSSYSPASPRHILVQTNRSKTSTCPGVTSSTGGVKGSTKSSPDNYAGLIPSADSIKYPPSPSDCTGLIPGADNKVLFYQE